VTCPQCAFEKASLHSTLASFAAARAAATPDAAAFIEGERSVSYAEFDALAGRAAAWLRAEGIIPGDRVALWFVNRVEWLALLFGLARVGACAVAVNTRFRSAELDYVLERSRAKMLVCQPGFRGIDFTAVLSGVDPVAARSVEKIAVIGETSDALFGKLTVSLDLLRHDPDARDDGKPDGLVILFTTSGTTKGPKLVMHTQADLALHSERVARAHGFDRPGARLLAALALCGVFGLNSTLAAFAGGAPSVLLETFDAAGAAALIRRHACTHMYGTDELYKLLLKETPGDDPFPSARLFGFAAAQPGGVEFALEAIARRVPFIGLYGSSEVHALFSMQSREAPVELRVEGGGIPASPDAEIRIRDLDTGELAAPGERGEVEIRAPTNFADYLDNPEATAEAIGPDGFFRTGDIGYLRGDGSWVFVTRRGDAMRLGGFLVNPEEIESQLKRIPGVAEAQVVAIEIDGRTRCVAFVIASPGATVTEADIIAAAAQSMAGFKVPARVWFVDAFPVTPSANPTKIQRGKLRGMALANLQDRPT
jgi:fatty-acyl-CoA synthase